MSQGLHNDWVRKVKYYPTLQCFISCATSSENSMYLGDVDRKKTCSMFRTRKGITSFDYCKEWNVIGKNMLHTYMYMLKHVKVTGGLDHYVRLWNPYVTSKSTSTLVVPFMINAITIISASMDKVKQMRVLIRAIGPTIDHCDTLFMISALTIISTAVDKLSVLEGKNDEPSEECEIMSHTKPLCAALYNDLFDQAPYLVSFSDNLPFPYATPFILSGNLPYLYVTPIILSGNLPYLYVTPIILSSYLPFLYVTLIILSGNLPYLYVTLIILSGNLPYLYVTLIILSGNLPYLYITLIILSGNLPYLYVTPIILLGNLPFPYVTPTIISGNLPYLYVTPIILSGNLPYLYVILIILSGNLPYLKVVSACHESVVCVWSLETGEKIIQFSNAHDDSEITAMSFDPSKRRLVTGARDGSVKIWNFNNGACLRVLHQVDDEEITGILCHKQHIITVGWSKNVIFHRNCRDDEEDVPRVWRAFHADDILSIALYHPSLVATSSYDGCVKIWNADTGHMSCLLNTNKYHSNTAGNNGRISTSGILIDSYEILSACVASSRLSQGHRPSSRSASRSGNRRSSLFRDPTLIAMSRPNSRLITPILPDIEVRESDHDSVVENVLFLQKRESHRQTATLVTSGSGGWVRLWTLFGGELLGQFMAAQSGKESVTALTTDSDNTMLVTADTLGYVRVWDISCYYIKESEKPPPKENPEERSDEDKHRQSAARRRANLRRDNLPLKIGNVSCVPPPLLCKFRAHLMCVVSLDFVSGKNLIVTASTDCSARLWTSAGRYVGTFGQKVLWDIERAIKDVLITGRAKLPHDILRNASPDTLKSLGTSGTYKWRRIAKQILNIANIGRHLTTKMADTSFDQQALEPSIKESMRNVLGKYYQPKTRHRLLPPIQRPRFNHNQVVVYSSLPYKDLETVDDANLSFVLGHPGEKSSLYSLRDGTESRGRTMKMGAPPSTTPKSQGPRTPASRGSDSRKGRTHV
ncbi:predicted protein [Nematostella vectensis]|uniref:WD repeat-containing protein on Y chromosome n=1 Tax=Nematostella vectensis TaxID=45351 RepID=A7SBD6_NEMVE|nr:predicted protein [Nematostella vectensis]|eukprot:XP_001631048.1 predicted protein [Nematostella vectensis]